MLEQYDFNFICMALGLIPIGEAGTAISPGAVVSLQPDKDDAAATVVTLINGARFSLSAEQMQALSATIEGLRHGPQVIGAKLVDTSKRRH